MPRFQSRHRLLIFSLMTALVVAALPATAATLEVGAKAPHFVLSDQNGKSHDLSDYEGKIVVLEWTNPQCPFVQRHYKEETMTSLASKYADKEVVWLAVDSSHFITAESAKAWVEKKELSYPILLDASGEVARQYGARTTPHMMVIGADGGVLYNGAIDDDPRGSKGEESVNYVDAALSSVLAGETVEPSSTKPYGCSVKLAPKGKVDKAVKESS